IQRWQQRSICESFRFLIRRKWQRRRNGWRKCRASPQCSFRHGPENDEKRNPSSGKWEANFQAQLTLRGVTRPVPFHGSAEQKGSRILISAEGVVKTSEFGVKPITYSGARVNDGVNIVVHDLPVEP